MIPSRSASASPASDSTRRWARLWSWWPAAPAAGLAAAVASTRMPAASPAAIPASLSSTTRQRAGAAASRSAASRYPTGSGLPRGTSSAHTTTAGASTPRHRSTWSASTRAEPVTIATGIPADRASASSSRTPGSSGKSCPNRRPRAAAVPTITSASGNPSRSSSRSTW